MVLGNNFIMMSLSKEEQKCTTETWRVYPRVHYFQRRYHDLVPRFKRVIGSFPKSFQVEKLIKEFDDIDNKLMKKVVVNVIGNCELDLAHIVVSTEPSEKEMFPELKEPSMISLFICYSKSEKLDESGLKSITSVIDKFYDDFGNENPHLFNNMFVVIETEQNYSDEERNTFREEVNEVIRVKLQDTDVQPRPDRIIFGSNGTVLGSKISEPEKTSAGHIISVMGKMMFEIERYLEQTITEKYEPKSATQDVPEELRDAILELKDVYGIGKVYDVFEIHVQEQTPTLKEDVSTLMRKYGYTQPYKVKTVAKELRSSGCRDMLKTNKGAHVYNGNGPTSRSGRSSTYTTCQEAAETNQSISTNEQNAESATQFTVKESEKPGINNRRRAPSTDISQEVIKRSKGCEEQTSTQLTDTQNNNTDKKIESLMESSEIPSDQECNTIAQNTGDGDGISLGYQSGLSDAVMSQIRADHRGCCVNRNTAILMKWKKKEGDRATFKELAKAMRSARMSPYLVFKESFGSM